MSWAGAEEENSDGGKISHRLMGGGVGKDGGSLT